MKAVSMNNVVEQHDGRKIEKPASPPWPEDDYDNGYAESSTSSPRTLSRMLRTIYNRWTYGYMDEIFKKGAQQLQKKKDINSSGSEDEDEDDEAHNDQLTHRDLYATPKSDEASLLNAKFWKLYNNNDEETKTTTDDHRDNFLRTLWLLAKPTFVPAGACQLVALATQLSIPLCVMRLLEAVEKNFSTSSGSGVVVGDGDNGDTNLVNDDTATIIYIVLVFILSVANGLCTHRYLFLSYRSGIVIRSAVTSSIHEQALKLSPGGREGLTSGNVTNLVATDAQKLFEVMHDGHMIWSCPLAILVVVGLLFFLIGPSCLVGAAILIGLVPLSRKVAHVMVQIRRRRVAVADERIGIVTAMLQDIKVTKLNNYEAQFEGRVADARKREMALVKKEQFVWGFTLVIVVFSPVISTFATFATYVLVDESNTITASTAFTLLMLFNMVKFPINQAGQLLSKAALGIQAMHRISNFMSRETEETNNGTKEHNDGADEDPSLRARDGDVVLTVENGSFSLGSHEPPDSTDRERPRGDGADCGSGFTLSGINLRLRRGEVLAVCGAVGSGKSSLIGGLLGEVQSSRGTMTLEMASDRSLAAQSPFILSTTVRANILFGSSYDKERYDRVLDACCLGPDLLQWPAGDLTEIGERGVTMSGGQKQRVSVARAVYANPDIGLFDDILSALDAGTSQRLFDNLFANVGTDDSLLHECGVVLVTHAVHILRRVGKILILDEGKQIFYGTWNDLQSFVPADEYREKIESMRSTQQLSAEEDPGKPLVEGKGPSYFVGSSNEEVDARKGELMTVEQREHGGSSISTWLLWFKYAGGILFVVTQIILMACDRGAYVAIDWWLAVWTSAAHQDITVFSRVFPSQLNGRSAQLEYITVYAILMVVMVFFLVARSQWAVFGGIRACTRVFSTMTHRVLHAPMSYFDCTPLGRILNRFTYDVEQVDITLSQFMSIFIIASSWLVAGQVVMISIVPFMALVNAFVMGLYIIVVRHYRWGAIDLQRLDAVSRSPIQASLAESLDGSSTIRAYRKNRHFEHVFQGYINDNSSAMLNFVSARRWLAVRLETLGAFVTLAACLCITTFNEQLGLSPGISGLLLIWASTFALTLGFLINAFSEAEAAITSIERMHSMEMLPQEKSMTTPREYEVDASWPREGLLEFNNVSMRYRPGLSLSLNNLSFTIQHGQRCAVVGRTGAGKSSLASALFRLVEIEQGSITLDGLDLSTLGLSDVRGRQKGMYILPQDPAVFSGDIRSNLDPFDMHNDDEVLLALTQVKFPGVTKGVTILKERVEESGANFSAGEKQLLCLARAMLASPRLLVLDEATSAVDGETDEFVQGMLRSQFPDTTLLTIAHRLNTIIDYDVVIVMDKGTVAEFGSPQELLNDKNGMFSTMVNATGPNSAAQLNKMAK